MGAARSRIWSADLAAVELAWRTWICPRSHIAQHFGTTQSTLCRLAKEMGWPRRKQTGRMRAWSAAELQRLKRALGAAPRRDIAARFNLSVCGLRAVIRRYNLIPSSEHPQSAGGQRPLVLAGPPATPTSHAGGPGDLRHG